MNTQMLLEVGWIVAAVLLVGLLCEAVRRLPIAFGLFTFLLLPAILGLIWAESSTDFDWFQWAKVYSVSLAAAGVVAIRAHRIERWGWGFPFLIALLVLNILEAVIAELRSGPGPNVLAGFLLLLCLPGSSAASVVEKRGYREVQYGLSLQWIIAYTIWNFAFVYQYTVETEGPGGSAGFAVAHLAVPLLMMRGNPARWIQARVFALAILMFWRFTFPEPPLLLRTVHWYTPTVHAALGGIALLCALLVVVRTWLGSKNGLLGLVKRWLTNWGGGSIGPSL